MYKRVKRIVPEESMDEDSGKPRRSSLQVNLSYLSNTNDASDHDSLENSRKNSLPSESETCTKKPERLLPRIVNIERHYNEENIFKDKILNDNCSQLRDVILRKTKELYDDPRCELIAKTEKVLQNDSQTRKISSQEIIETDATSRNEQIQKSPSIRVALGEDQQLTMSGAKNKNRELVSVNTMKSPQKETQQMETPRRRISAEFLLANRRSSLNQKRLFPNENDPEILETPNRLASPILSGTSKKRAKILLRKNSDLQELPVTCSTFIDERSKKASQTVEDSPKYSSQDKRVVSMELTEVKGKILTTPWKLTKTTSNDCPDIEENSIPSTTRTSLNVNTSIDQTQGTSQNRSRFRLPDSPIKENDLEIQREKREETKPETQNQENSKNSQLTSTRFKKKKLFNVNSIFDDPVEILENRSLKDRLDVFPKPTSVRIEKLRNSSELREMRSGKSRNSNNFGEMSHVDGTPLPVSRSFMWKSQIRQGTFASNSHESQEKIISIDVDEKRKSGKESRERHPALDSSESEMESQRGNSFRELTGRVISETSSKSSKIGESSNNSKLSRKTYASHSHESPEKILPPIHKNVKRKRGTQSKERHPALDSSESEMEWQRGNSSRESARRVISETSSKSSKTGESLNNSKLLRKKKLYTLRGYSQLLSTSPVNTPTPQPKVITQRRKNLKYQKFKASQRTQKMTPKVDTDTDSGSDTDFQPSAQTQKEKPRKKTRKVLRKKIVIKPLSNSNTQKPEDRRKRNLIDSESQARSRRSSLTDFETVEEERTKKRTRRFLIVATGFSNGDKRKVKDAVKKLGKAEMETNVSRKTTHVVSTGVRTINLLKGILRGCWLVSLNWVLESLKAGKWLNPEQFELEHFSTSVKENRRERQLFGNAFKSELFFNCGLIYVASGTTPSPPVLKDLIKTAGGQITEKQGEAKITIGSKGLRENWILDSITTGKIQPEKQYRIK